MLTAKEQAYLNEITKKVYTAPRREVRDNFDLQKYLGTKYEVIGLSVPQQQKLFKSGYNFSDLPINDQLMIWDMAWKNSDIFEVLSQCLYFFDLHYKKFDSLQLWKLVKTWVKKIDNWANSDDLSSIYARIMEREPAVIYKQLQQWNQSKNPWERRQSLVTMLLYCRRKKQEVPVKDVLALIEPRLEDENYFVQKGVGWALRDTGVVYPKEVGDFLQKHISKIDPAAFTAAVEKIDPVMKNKLKSIRKEGRKKLPRNPS